ncbi:MAG: type II toxin-antitoxin system VapC family toxin [Thaumarchaeota archaeon]|nr:type II toxin-antitoxin system VapC family toxin [Candidatus Geocrenenecus arthurdayi]MCL7402119.1 type II toxin-antitoxin system VapC family toxin [Candidatus Geocrenenecus arthurdayi]MCL7403934.1 type II toxin-antitoxin system VapC family toxin [Candidatus Geocrenenecus arthurdayi]
MIDASVIAKLIMREENYVEAAKEIEADDETLDLAILEVANVILKYHRRGILPIEEMLERFEELKELSKTLKILDFKKFLEQAFEFAITTNLTIYDSLYIVASSKLVTSDINQAEAAKQHGRRVVLV